MLLFWHRDWVAMFSNEKVGIEDHGIRTVDIKE